MRKLIAIAALAACVCTSATAQKRQTVDYRKSSMIMLMMEEPDMDPAIAAHVRDAFNNARMPNKFNDHGLDSIRTFVPCPVSDLTAEDYAAFDNICPKNKAGSAFAKIGAGLLDMALRTEAPAEGQSSASDIVQEQEELKRNCGTLALKYMLENRMANKAMDKWFCADSNGLSMQLIQDRAVSDATPLEKLEAMRSSDEMGLLTEIGLDLIGNTFFTVSQYRYMTSIEYADEVARIADAMTGGMGLKGLMDIGTGLAKDVSKKDGYVVTVRTLLFQLVYDENVNNAIQENFNSYEGYRNLNFDVKFLGMEKAFADCAAKKSLTQEEIIRTATVRAFDKVIAKLEKKYEDFRTKSPIFVEQDEKGNPVICAEIGTNESVSAKDRFEVLEAKSPDGVKIVYTVKGVVSADPKAIWDNDPDSETYVEGGYTRFIGKKIDAHNGMFIRQKSVK